MIKEALQYIVSLNTSGPVTVDSRQYCMTDKGIQAVKEPLRDTLKVSTLGSIVEYITMNVDALVFPVMIHVVSPTKVQLISRAFGDFEQRHIFMEATPMIPEVDFGKWRDVENFNIYMQSQFEHTEDKEAILMVVGNIKEEQVKTTGDDGVSQVVTAKVGVASLGTVKVPNPVVLKPFRTFVEIDQPESQFVFRMQSGPQCVLYEADGGAWKVEAMARISDYFEIQLRSSDTDEKLFDTNQVVILA